MVEVGMGFSKLTIGGGPNNLKVLWSDSKLDSACTRFIGNSPGGQRPGHGAAVPLKEDQDEPGSHKLVLFPREQIGDGLSLGKLRGVEEGRGELRARRRDDRQLRSARFVREDPTGSRRTRLFQATLRPVVGRAGLGASRRCDG